MIHNLFEEVYNNKCLFISKAWCNISINTTKLESSENP